MRAPAATASMLSAAVLLVPGCGPPAAPPPSKEEPVRRATFRSLAARDFLATCPDAARRPETLRQAERFEALKQLAARKGAGRAVWLGENDWAGMARYADREPCAAGEEGYREALAAFGGALDLLAAQVAGYPAEGAAKR